MKLLKPCLNSLSVMFGISVCFSSTALLANAAGFDDPYASNQSETNTFAVPRASAPCTSEAVENNSSNGSSPGAPNQTRRPCPLTLEWQRWSTTYIQDNNFCRELNGNVVCITPTSAERLRW